MSSDSEDCSISANGNSWETDSKKSDMMSVGSSSSSSAQKSPFNLIQKHILNPSKDDSILMMHQHHTDAKLVKLASCNSPSKKSNSSYDS